MYLRRLFRRGSSDIIIRRVYPWSFLSRYQAWEMQLGPDGRHERRFRPLVESDPDLDRRMREAFVARWLPECGFPASRHDEALETLDLRLARRRLRGGPDLRITSDYTGSTRWLFDWSGDDAEAITFAAESGLEEAYWVHAERRLNGPTPWD